MADPEDRDAGFYWISIDGQEVEVAQWQSEWSQWLVTGSTEPLSDAVSAHVLVLSEALPVPVVDMARAKAG
ncbi:MAG: hypothetical protein EON47_01445 [Acetobacteraceae bacterium]|nr:MAG: hypothetical protein EON47_01445 [Acetobacteraceae bacterium]